MSMKEVLVFFLFLLHIYVSFASDPDPVRDFCVVDRDVIPHGTCKNSSTVSVEDFTFSGFKSHTGKFDETGFSSIRPTTDIFPGLNTLGMSVVRADFEVGGVNVPHTHPRATEIGVVLEGKLYAGFVDTQNRVFAKVIEKGEAIVFPRGLVHFQMNIGDTRATILGSLNSENPGLQKIPTALFGTGIEGKLLEKAFGLSAKEIAKLRRRFASNDLLN